MMRQRKASRSLAKAAKLDRRNDAAIQAALLLLIAGLLIGQLLLMSP
ncbi:MAG: hypothetical protein MPJ78_08960 [Hyphomicrobiaceae bacterium]|nr:hypothetical protein [Hyphomicrobiaceae bacterium]